MNERYDIVIAGGGMVGASLAVAVAPLGLRIAVVEPHMPKRDGQPSFDDRATAVGLGSQRILVALGCWDEVAPGSEAIRQIRVSERGRFGRTSIDADDLGVDALGYVVENRRLGRVLWDALEDSPSVTLLTPATVTGRTPGSADDRLSLDVSGGPVEISTRLLVVADGARSRLRATLGIGASVEPYGQVAVITNVTTGKPHDGVAFERFTPSGPLAFLPLAGGRSSVVWTVHPERAERLLAGNDETFRAALQRAFGYRLGRLDRIGARASYPLALIRADRVTGDRLVVIGNAATGLHPVAGQGFNLGLRDVAALAQCLADGRRDSRRTFDPGDAAILRAYRANRAGDRDATATLTDGLVRLFCNPLEPLGALRALGLTGLDLVGPARRHLAWQMMGLGGFSSRLARGLALDDD